MIHKLSEDIWFGDKSSVNESLGQVQSIINVAHSIRKPYWEDLGKLDWRVQFFRLALPDAEPATSDYIHAFGNVLDAIKQGRKFPLLCHCQMGRHRGPTSAIFSYWYINGRSSSLLQKAIQQTVDLQPDYMRPHPRRVYRDTILAYCEKESQR